MRPVALGRPYGNDPNVFRKWVLECFAEIERAAQDELGLIANDFTVSGHTQTRTLDAATATTSDIADVLCTLIEDLQNRGMKRTQ